MTCERPETCREIQTFGKSELSANCREICTNSWQLIVRYSMYEHSATYHELCKSIREIIVEICVSSINTLQYNVLS